MKKLHFGTAGIPILTDSKNTENGILMVKELGLDAMELEFVYKIYINKEKASSIKKVAKESGVLLTCHAPYYINLNSKEKRKIIESKIRILNAAKISYICGAWSLCFHSGFYMKMRKENVYKKIKMEIKDIVKKLYDIGIKIWIRPETTGKKSQFGTLNEILRLSSEIEGVMPCIDFAHIHAREKKWNSYSEFCKIFELIEKYLGKEGLKNIHAHVSGVAYNKGGERYHLNLNESDFNYIELIKALKDFKVKGILISESPNIEGDAIILKNYFSNIEKH